MKKLNNNDIMDYLDGTLSASRKAEVETVLRSDAEEASLVADMKFAREALVSWNGEEPVQASENFWPKLRGKLPADPPKRSLLRRIGLQVAAQFRPRPTWRVPGSPLSLSAGIAAIAAVSWMVASSMAPKPALDPVSADTLSLADQAFISQSIERHQAYTAVPSVNAALRMPAGDAGNADFGDQGDAGPSSPSPQ